MIPGVLRAAVLDARLYQGLRETPMATVQAVAVVVLSGLSLGLGLFDYFPQEGLEARAGVMVRAVAAALAVWMALGLLAHGVGRLLVRGTVTFPSVLRSIGYANAPGLLYILVMVGGILALLTNAMILLWILLTTMVALRHTLQVSWFIGFWLSGVGLLMRIFLFRLIVAVPPTP